MKHEGWRSATAAIGLNLTAGQVDQLTAFERLLSDRAVPAGFIAERDRARIDERHVLDSLRGTALVPSDARNAADLGSGAGLPGIAIAIALPHLQVALSEVRRARLAFLELAIDELGLTNAAAVGGPAEQALAPASQDACFARAFADARGSWRIAEPLLRPRGVLIYWAGEHFSAGDLPEDVTWRETRPGTLARSGPLVMMAR